MALNECRLTINLPYWFNTSFHYHAILILLNECKQLSAAAYTHQILIKDSHQYTIIISIIYYIVKIHFQFEINVLIKNIKMFKSTLAVLLLLKMHFVFSNHQNKQSNKKESSTQNLLLWITFVSKQYLQFDTSESNTTIKQNDCFLFRKLSLKFCDTNFFLGFKLQLLHSLHNNIRYWIFFISLSDFHYWQVCCFFGNRFSQLHYFVVVERAFFLYIKYC